LTSVYTNLLLDGALVAVEFMPFVCSVAYLVFIVYYSEAGRIRSQLEQMQAVLNLQITQAVREIEALRESWQKTRTYRHDLRHHMQYISSCIENGRLEHAQGYIREICSEIEMNEVIVYCENEAANLIFSAFAGRAKDCGIPITIRAGIAQSISISESDLCVLLSNALENALRACRRRKDKGLSATIEVDAYQRNGKFFLQAINSCEEDIAFENGLPVTNKPGHGIGVRSICAVVERYNGIYSFSVKDDKFILRVSL
ncbi:MAG: GHKL domain-containing protein, partial [Lachnospiraceae bacterium]|nr:GHKL domain-containing protein [Lachnospiraceae bacterium]